jgi:2-polyprenyl-6-methoxyphenol hydroxylase-like FAD-dependent oxidoreductase
MRIRCVGGGRAGLMFAILARSAGHEVTVYEQVQPAESFGWGVVFWERAYCAGSTRTTPRPGGWVRENAYT